METFKLIRQPERWSRVLGWATFAGLELGLIGPFGSYAASPFNRIAYWTALCWLGALLLWPTGAVAIARGRGRGFPPAFSGAVTLLSGCVPLAALAAFGCGLLWPKRASGMHAVEWYVLTLLVAFPAMVVLLWLERGAVAPEPVGLAVTEDGAEVPTHRLALALCLQMEDHHVRVHLAGGSSLHLASLRETVARPEAARGRQVHRSWWVARDAVAGWTEEGRSATLLLINGLRVPIARNRLGELRAAGWLDAGLRVPEQTGASR